MANENILKSWIPLICSLICIMAVLPAYSNPAVSPMAASATSVNVIKEAFTPVVPSLELQEARLLWALNQQEASGRGFIKARYEPNFYEKYLKNNAQFSEAEQAFGKHAIASSYGPWQIMYATAVQMGYKGSPQSLSHAFVSLPYVVKYLRHLYKKFDGSVESVISAYNAGPGGVGTNPNYTNKVLTHLDQAPKNWQVFGT